MGARIIKRQIVWTNTRKLSVSNTLRMGSNMDNEARPPWKVPYTRHLRNVTTFLQCCRHEDCSAMHMPTVHSSQCCLPCWKHYNCPPLGHFRSLSPRGVPCCLLASYIRFLRKFLKQEALSLKTVVFSPRKIIRNQIGIVSIFGPTEKNTIIVGWMCTLVIPQPLYYTRFRLGAEGNM